MSRADRHRLFGAVSRAVVGVLLLVPLPVVAQQLGGPTQSAIAGSQVFGAKRCVQCHAIDGQGGTVGPDLGRIGEQRSLYGLAADMWNHVPRMVERTEQLGVQWPRLSRQQAGDLIAFLFTVNYFDRVPDTEMGERLYTQKRCVLCHQVGGVGGVVGPNLDYLGERGSPIQVASAMWNHGPAMTRELHARGLERPSFNGTELLDLIGYIRSESAAITNEPLYVVPGDATKGSDSFDERGCVQCHGVRGRGGTVGPDLAAFSAKRSLIEFAAAMWNKQPRMFAAQESERIAIQQVSAEEMADLVAYLYSVRYFADAGSPRTGRALIAEKGCLGCHALGGHGAALADDLGQVSGLTTPAEVISVLWNHALVDGQNEKQIIWPSFTDVEMADLAAFLQLPAPR
jgi:mono/diheme cytochrome c family protein